VNGRGAKKSGHTSRRGRPGSKRIALPLPNCSKEAGEHPALLLEVATDPRSSPALHMDVAAMQGEVTSLQLVWRSFIIEVCSFLFVYPAKQTVRRTLLRAGTPLLSEGKALRSGLGPMLLAACFKLGKSASLLLHWGPNAGFGLRLSSDAFRHLVIRACAFGCRHIRRFCFERSRRVAVGSGAFGLVGLNETLRV